MSLCPLCNVHVDSSSVQNHCGNSANCDFCVLNLLLNKWLGIGIARCWIQFNSRGWGHFSWRYSQSFKIKWIIRMGAASILFVRNNTRHCGPPLSHWICKGRKRDYMDLCMDYTKYFVATYWSCSGINIDNRQIAHKACQSPSVMPSVFTVVAQRHANSLERLISLKSGFRYLLCWQRLLLWPGHLKCTYDGGR